jgi:hypothetical protein
MRSDNVKVKCINNKHHELQLTVGKIYGVVQENKLHDAYFIKADDGRMWWMHIKRFIVIDK